MLRETIKSDGLPDYTMAEEPGDVFLFTPRSLVEAPPRPAPRTAPLAPETHAEARRRAPGADVYALEALWRAETPKAPRDPDAAFLAWLGRL